MRTVTAAIALLLAGLSQAGHAQGTAPAKAASAPRMAAAGVTWAELSPAQQQALKPLAQNWGSISERQKRKWLEVSRSYASLSPEGQATMHSRMNEWVTLSPQQRAQARLNFATTRELSKQLTPEEKKAKWQTYQALSAEEKQKLAAVAAPRPAGAATAVKPVAPQKLANVPPHEAKAGIKPAARIAPSQPVPAPAPGAITPAAVAPQS